MSSRRQIRWAVGLWLCFAFVVWNVIFDRMLVLAGRRYSHDAYTQFHTTGQYLKIDDVMRPAISSAFRVASLAAAGIIVVSMAAIWMAARSGRRRQRPGPAEAEPRI